MQRSWFVLAILLTLGPTGLEGQKPVHPNFSGEWLLDSTRSSIAAPANLTAQRGEGSPDGAPAASPAGVSGELAAAIRAGGIVKEPTKIRDVPPRYPQDAIKDRIMGTVILDAVIGTDGHVKDLKILKSVDGLDDAATDAVSQWQYSQTVLNGAPVEVLFTITVNFTLNLPGGSSGSNAPAFGERGAAGAPIFTIKQDDKTLKMTRSLPSGSATIIYRLDGKGSTNRLVPGPSAGDVVYISRWESGVLTSRIIVPGGPGQMSERKETIALEADTLVIRTTRFDSATRAERVVQTSVYVKGR